MSRRNKLQKFEDLLAFQNVFESFDHNSPGVRNFEQKIIEPKGKWSALFPKDQPLTLELACGKGHYTLGLAKRYPERNFLGIDIKGARIWRGAKDALEENIPNAAFLRCDIFTLPRFFDRAEVDEIWITFPDPFLSKENRRLTNSRFLSIYRQILKPGGLVHLKTDSTELYAFTKEVLELDNNVVLVVDNDDIYSCELPVPELGIKTEYEGMHLEKGKKIKYLQFTLN